MKNWLKASLIVASAFFVIYLVPSITNAAATVTGTVYDYDNQPVNLAWLNITNSNSGTSFNTRLTDGQFSQDLENGNYLLSAYWIDATDEMVVLNKAFSVTGSVYSPDPLIASAGIKNVNGTLHYASDNAININNVYIYFQKTGGQEEFIRTKVQNGVFSLFLADGSYTVDGFWDPSTSEYQKLTGVANSTFTVGTGLTPSNLIILIPSNNVTGSLNQMNSDNTQAPLNNVNLSLHKINDQGQPSEWYNTKVSNGAFNLNLDDGNYQVDGAWDEINSEYVQLNNLTNSAFSVVNHISNPNIIALMIPLKNVNGILLDESNGPISGVWLFLHSTANDNQLGYNVHVSNGGTFSTSLPDGSYQIEGYWDPINGSNHSQKASFSVTSGVLVNGTNVINGSLHIIMHNSNVNGVLHFDDATTVIGNLNLHNVDSPNEWFNASVNQNAFHTYLPEGRYQVDGFWNVNDQEYTSLTTTITVLANGTVSPNPLVINVPSKNITGTIAREANGSAVINDKWLFIHRADKNENRGYSAYVKNGSFSLALEDGSYQVDGLSDSNSEIAIHHNFTVSNGHLSQPLAIIIKTENVHGTLKKSDNTPITLANLYINNKDNFEYYSTQVNNGIFNIYLPDGHYEAYGYWDQATQEYIELKSSFTLVNGVPDSSSIDIVISDKNVTGTIINSNGVPFDSGWLSLYQTNSNGFNTSYNAQVKDGSFSLYLPDGHYKVASFNQQSGTINKIISLNYEFNVANGQSSPNPLTVVVLPSNIHGTLKNANHANITGSLYFHLQNENLGTSVNVQDGSFDLYLPDGTYEIDGFWDSISQSYNQLEGTIHVSNGALVGTLNIVVPSNNVFGTLTQSNGSSLTDGSVQLQSVGMSQNKGYSANVTNGVFTMYLPDGSYQVTGYYNKTTGTKPLTKSFTVTNGVSNPASIDLVIHPSNVSGTLKNADGSNITGYLYFQLQNENFGSSITVVNGTFDLYLPNGTYQIYGVSNNNSYNQLSESITFIVSNSALVGSINILVPVNNVHGSVTLLDGSSLTNGSVQLQTVGMSQNKGYSANVTNGVFSMYLPDGSYQVTGYYNQTAGTKPLTKNFTVTNGVSNPASIDLVIHPSNVSGTFKNADGSNITGNLNFQLQNANFGSSVNVVNGAFDLYLPDGTYQINGYSDNADHTYHQFSGTFTVSNGGLVGTLHLVVPLNNIHGLVTRMDGVTLGDISIQLQTVGLVQNKGYSANVTNGSFSMYLPDGSYQVTGYYNQTTGTKPLTKNFTVTNGLSNPASIDLVIHPSNVSGTLKNAGGSNITGNLNFQLQNANFGSSVSVVNGAFDLYLPDGTYHINGYLENAGNSFIQLSGTFTVTNGALVGMLNIVTP